MTITEKKKLIYKQNPIANLFLVCNGVLHYRTTVNDGATFPTFFEIPISDIGTTDFFPEMSAKHLLRWIVDEGNYKTNKL